MVSPQLVKYKIAKALAASLKDSIKFLYSNYKAEYMLLRERFPDDEHYRREVQKLLNDFQSSVKKVIGSDEMDIENHLFYELAKLEFREGLNPNYESFVKLTKWYSEDREVRYVSNANVDLTNLGTFKAESQLEGKTKESINFDFSYLEDEFDIAIKVFAQKKLIGEIESSAVRSNESDIAKEPLEQPTHKIKAKPTRNKLSWIGDEKTIDQMFFELSKHTFKESGKKVIEANGYSIKEMIRNNFDFSEKPTNVPALDTTKRLLYNGEISALVRLFYVLDGKKSAGGFGLVDSDTNSILNFIHCNFKWYDKDDNKVKQIAMRTLEHTWERTEKSYKSTSGYSKLIDNESNPQKIKKSLIIIVRNILTGR